MGEQVVVLNNQHRDRLNSVLANHRGAPESEVLFQPYTEVRMLRVHDVVESGTPVPVFFVVGNYGTEVAVMGLLRRAVYREDLNEEQRAEVVKLRAEGDTEEMARNILFVSHTVALKEPLRVEEFVKVNDGDPLKPGRWPGVICTPPPLSRLIAVLSGPGSEAIKGE